MTISDLINHVKTLRPGMPYTDSVFLAWVNDLEAELHTEVYLLSIEDYAEHTAVTESVTVDATHTKIFWSYLLAMISLANGEASQYNNDFAIFKGFMNEYKAWYATTYHPADGAAIASGYYLTAYALAVKYGFEGTEEEWVEAVESSRVAAETAAVNAQTAQVAAEEAQTAAEAAKDYVVTNTGTAQTAADTATRKASEAAASAAAAADSATGAALKAAEAADSATAAANSSTAASGSASSASTASAEADAAQQAAETAKAAAEQAQSLAESAKAVAELAATNAGTSETNAGTSESNAANAQTAAENAQSLAETANTAAQEAKAAAEAAAGKTSYIGENGNWYQWDADTQAFIDTGVSATGPQGEVGPQGYNIGSVYKKSGTGTAGTTDVYGMKINDAAETEVGTFNVYNGADGDMPASMYDPADGKRQVAFQDEIPDIPTSFPKTSRFVVGTSTAGWTNTECDYLCDGTDDQVEINAAIEALPSTGGEIVILDGTYNITAVIGIHTNNVSIRGNGAATVLKRMWDSGDFPEGVINCDYRSTVQSLCINGNRSLYTSNNNCGIFFKDRDSRGTATGNTCYRCAYGIYLCGESNTVTGNTCEYCVYGIYSGGYYDLITSNISDYCDYGIYLLARRDYGIIANNLCSNGNYGIYSANDGCTITGNLCFYNTYDIYLSGIQSTVTGNICSNPSNVVNYGIYLGSSYNSITGNVCRYNAHGIYLNSSSNNSITGNTCIRGTGQASDYTEEQYTIKLAGTGNNYNLISSNNCMGKAIVIEGGTSNTEVNNKYQ